MGLFGDAYDTVAGVADAAALNVDESIGRQFDNTPGGGFADITESGDRASVDTDGDGQADEYNNRYLQGDSVRTAYDMLFSYGGTLNGEGDTADVFGPALWGDEGSVADTVVDVEGEEHGAGETKTTVLMYAVVAVVVLYLLAPLLELGAAVAGEK